MIGTELEVLLRRLVREEVARLVGVEVDDLPEDDADLRERAAAHAARIRGRSKAGAR